MEPGGPPGARNLQTTGSVSASCPLKGVWALWGERRRALQTLQLQQQGGKQAASKHVASAQLLWGPQSGIVIALQQHRAQTNDTAHAPKRPVVLPTVCAAWPISRRLSSLRCCCMRAQRRGEIPRVFTGATTFRPLDLKSSMQALHLHSNAMALFPPLLAPVALT